MTETSAEISMPVTDEMVDAAARASFREGFMRHAPELAESWRYKGEFGGDDGSHAYGPDPEGEALDRASAELVSKIQEVLSDE